MLVADHNNALFRLEERAGECRLLSHLLARPPDWELLCDAALLGLLENEWESRIEEIQVEFTRLFSAPGVDAIPVHQSVYTDVLRIAPAENSALICGASFAGGEYPGYLGGTSCQEALRWYNASSFKAPSHEMPDHISVQLDFIAHLLLSEAYAIKAGYTDNSAAWRERRQEFISHFLGRWIETFAEKVASNSVSEFYRRVGRYLANLAKEFFSKRNRQFQNFEQTLINEKQEYEIQS